MSRRPKRELAAREPAMRNFGDLLNYNYSLRVYCPVCKVERPLDLKRQDPDRSYLHATYRCRDCRAVGEPLIGPANLFRG